MAPTLGSCLLEQSTCCHAMMRASAALEAAGTLEAELEPVRSQYV